MEEIWKDYPGREGYYQVSNFGRARSLDRTILCKGGWTQYKAGCILKPISNGNGYFYVCFWLNNICDQKYLHRIVLETFVGLPLGNKTDAAHWDGNKANNNLSNLRWATKKENQSDKLRHGTWFKKEEALKTQCLRGHLYNEPNKNNYGKRGYRSCRACSLMLAFVDRLELKGHSINEEVRQIISDKYYDQIIGEQKIYFQPLCIRGHFIDGQNKGLYKKYNKNFCKACDSARGVFKRKKEKYTPDQIKFLSDELYVSKFGGDGYGW